MKIFAAKNCSWLFIKCILYPSLLNAAFFLTARFLDLSMFQCDCLGCVQILCGILLARAIRKGSRETVLREPRKRKVYAALACIPLLALLYDMFFPMNSKLMDFYVYFLELVYHRIGYAHMNNYTDLVTVSICLACVFFYRFRWLEYIQNYFQEWKVEFLHK